MPSISERKVDALLNGEVLFVMIDMMQFINKGSGIVWVVQLFTSQFRAILLSRHANIFSAKFGSSTGTRNNDVK